jgi:hypothetical protein
MTVKQQIIWIYILRFIQINCKRFLLTIGRIAVTKFYRQYNGEAYAILVNPESRCFDYWNNACYIIHSH